MELKRGNFDMWILVPVYFYVVPMQMPQVAPQVETAKPQVELEVKRIILHKI